MLGRRFFWFFVGVVVGLWASQWIKRKLKKALIQQRFRNRFNDRIRSISDDLRSAISEGREAIRNGIPPIYG